MNQPSPCGQSGSFLLSTLRSRAHATARITGSRDYPNLFGTVRLYQTAKGVVVYAEISGLPKADALCQERVFGFHIHEGTDCGGDMNDPFADVMSHYDPSGCGHPHHAGDLTPLFGNDGAALCALG